MGVSPSDIRIVVFDWGGVILRICRSWGEGCERAGLDDRLGADTDALHATRHAIAQDYQTGAFGCDTFFDRIAESMGGRYTPGEVRMVHDAWLIEEYPGVAALLARITGLEHVTTGMLSNTNHRHWMQQLRPDEGGTSRFPAARMLTHRHASHLLGAAKPGRGIYEAFERETGFAGSEVLFFDDLDENIAAARELGWHAEAIDHEGDTAAQIERLLCSFGVL